MSCNQISDASFRNCAQTLVWSLFFNSIALDFTRFFLVCIKLTTFFHESCVTNLRIFSTKCYFFTFWEFLWDFFSLWSKQYIFFTTKTVWKPLRKFREKNWWKHVVSLYRLKKLVEYMVVIFNRIIVGSIVIWQGL